LLQQMQTRLLERCTTRAKHFVCLCVIHKELC